MIKYFFALLFLVLFFGGCSTRSMAPSVDYSQDMSGISSSMPKKNYSHPTMRPYEIRGITYYPTEVSVGDIFKGVASWYGPDFHGKKTSNGEIYNMNDMTAAHKTLPMNTIVKVTNQKNNLSTIVRINDRGPFVASRIIDLSNLAARKLDVVRDGTAPVVVEVLGFASGASKAIPTTEELKRAPQKVALEGFALQIGAFSRFEGATQTQKKYDNIDGYKTIIKDVDTDNGRLFRVWLKGFKSEAEARDYMSKSKFNGSFIVKED